jgi:hypothetical protein
MELVGEKAPIGSPCPNKKELPSCCFPACDTADLRQVNRKLDDIKRKSGL